MLCNVLHGPRFVTLQLAIPCLQSEQHLPDDVLGTLSITATPNTNLLRRWILSGDQQEDGQHD